jgi:hypothetical protein
MGSSSTRGNVSADGSVQALDSSLSFVFDISNSTVFSCESVDLHERIENISEQGSSRPASFETFRFINSENLSNRFFFLHTDEPGGRQRDEIEIP